jgi:outer membrane beta-barrel protein
MKTLIALFVASISAIALADVQSEVDSFGGNQALYEKAKALNPEVEKTVIQDRFMNRTNRWELAPEMAQVDSGDSYNRTSNAGLNVHYHINPSWSLGVKYNYSFNKLTPEGEAMLNKATDASKPDTAAQNFLYPQVVYPKSALIGLVNWYPMVGKLSFGSWGVAHFDTYLNLGYGQIELSNASTSTMTGGIGVGFWWTSHLTTRLEYRYQEYNAEYYLGERKINSNVAAVQMGWML